MKLKGMAKLEIEDTDILIGIGLGAGKTNEDCGQFVGITGRTVQNRKQRDDVQWIRAKVAAAVATTIERNAAITRADLEKEFEKRLASGLKAIDDALEAKKDGEVDHRVRIAASQTIFDRAVGKPTQRVETEATNRHVFELPTAVLERISTHFGVSPQIEGEVLDAEVIEEGAEALA